MKLKFKAFTTAALFGVMVLANANVETTKSVGSNQGEAMVASEEMTATVKNIDYNSRKVSLMTADGKEFDIIASDMVKNLKQIKKGDTVTAKYTEAVVYNINKGGKAIAPTVTTAATSARPGSQPEAKVARQVTATVIISEIDRKTPSVTFKGASGETQTFKVMHPEKLNGVNVGDSVDITYTEALALKVDKKQKQ